MIKLDAKLLFEDEKYQKALKTDAENFDEIAIQNITLLIQKAFLPYIHQHHPSADQALQITDEEASQAYIIIQQISNRSKIAHWWKRFLLSHYNIKHSQSYHKFNFRHTSRPKGEELEDIEQLLIENTSVMNAEDISSLLFCFSKQEFKHRDRAILERIFKLLVPRISQVQNWNAQEIGMSLCGLLNIDNSIIPSSLLKAFAQAASQVQTWNSQGITLALYGLHRIKTATSEELQSMLVQQIEKIQNISATNIQALIQSLSLCNQVIPSTLQLQYQKIFETDQGPQSNGEKAAFSIIQSLYSGNIRQGAFIDGFELDFYFPDLKLNIEIDGIHHQHQKIKDNIRDKHLESKGIQVIRIPLNEDWQDLLPPIFETRETTFRALDKVL